LLIPSVLRFLILDDAPFLRIRILGAAPYIAEAKLV
jgi:hypothetical protein